MRITAGRHPLCAGIALAVILTSSPPRAAEEAPQLSLIAAVRSALEHSPDIRLAEIRARQAQGSIEAARGIFDETVEASFVDDFTATPLTSDQETALGYSSSQMHTTTSSLGVSRLFPSGLRAGPRVSYERVDDTAGSIPTSNLATIDFTVTMPIWQGRGEAVVRAVELSAEAGWRARQMQSAHAAATAVSRVVDAYWNYLAAFQSLNTARQSEGKAAELLGTIRLLVDADERPAIDLLYLKANLASKSSARISADLLFRQSRHALCQAMGLDASEIDQIGMPSTDFPGFSAADLPEPDRLAALTGAVITRRADLLALERDKDGATVDLAAARDRRRPRLDLEFTAGYTGLGEGSDADGVAGAYGADGVGTHALLSLSYAWPLRQTTAAGKIHQAEAQADLAAATYDDQLRKVRTSLAAAFDEVRISGQVLLKSQEAATYYQQAAEGEAVKLTQGMTTIMDYVAAVDKHIDAMREVITARLNYAAALIALRYEAGAIVAPEGGPRSLSLADLTSMP